MKLETPKHRQRRLQRQELWRRARAEAPTMRARFPRVERLRIELNFVDMAVHTPADQMHTMHRAAQAFFCFPCPYSDCDGRFELDAAVAAGLTASVPDCEGELQCTGHRLRDGDSDRPCGLQLRYAFSARYCQPGAALPGGDGSDVETTSPVLDDAARAGGHGRQSGEAPQTA
jgi:hypothetical protein